MINAIFEFLGCLLGALVKYLNCWVSNGPCSAKRISFKSKAVLYSLIIRVVWTCSVRFKIFLMLRSLSVYFNFGMIFLIYWIKLCFKDQNNNIFNCERIFLDDQTKLRRIVIFSITQSPLNKLFVTFF